MIKKDRVVKICLAVMFIAAVAVGGSIAFFRTEKDAKSPISSTNLGIEIMENNQAVQDGEFVLNNLTPGATIDKKLYVENVKDSSSYIRVTLTKFWQDENGKKLPEKDAKEIIVNVFDDENWIIDNKSDQENGEVIYLYYRLPIASQEETTNFLDSIQISETGKTLDNSYAGLSAVVDVEVDAIQQYAAQEAILAEWGLDVEFNGDRIQVVE